MQDYQRGPIGRTDRQRDYLLEISRAMTSRLDLPSLLELTLRSAVELLRGQVGLIVLRDRDGAMRVRASYGLPARLVRFFQPLWADLPGGRDRQTPLSRWRIPDLQVRLGMVAAAAGLALEPGGGPAAGHRRDADRRHLYLSHRPAAPFRQAIGPCWLPLPTRQPSPCATPSSTSR